MYINTFLLCSCGILYQTEISFQLIIHSAIKVPNFLCLALYLPCVRASTHLSSWAAAQVRLAENVWSASKEIHQYGSNSPKEQGLGKSQIKSSDLPRFFRTTQYMVIRLKIQGSRGISGKTVMTCCSFRKGGLKHRAWSVHLLLNFHGKRRRIFYRTNDDWCP